MKAVCCLATLILVIGGVASPAVGQDQESALAIEREVRRIADERELWPGFDPLIIPLAVFTGEHTYLFRHPAPPDGFTELEGVRPRAFVVDGRYPGVTANSSTEIGGTVTATLLADGMRARQDATVLAAVALHEAFHVYQRAHHPTWSGNEGDLFLYPVDNARLLALRRLESAALREALESADDTGASCWTRLALEFRGERFQAMDSVFTSYERLNELNEGLAAYVQLLAAGEDMIDVPVDGFHATDVRDRIYVTGPAFSLLLDRLRPGWQNALEADDGQYLDEMLEVVLLADSPGKEVRCAIEANQTAQIEQKAQRDAAAVIETRSTRREQFDAREGWRVVVQAAEEEPFWPQGFDPLNVERVDGGILHTRLLHLGNEAGELQAIDEEGADVEMLTEGIGPHPLFNGTRRVTIAGLSEPEIVTEDRRVTIRAPGLSAQFNSARVQVVGMEVHVDLASGD